MDFLAACHHQATEVATLLSAVRTLRTLLAGKDIRLGLVPHSPPNCITMFDMVYALLKTKLLYFALLTSINPCSQVTAGRLFVNVDGGG